MPNTDDRISTDVLTPASCIRSFDVFTADLASWWPREYTWSQENLETISIEPRVNGRCAEFGPYGFQIDWGRVLVWDRPSRLQISWHIGFDRVPQPDPAKASVVEVQFSPEGSSTRVRVIHSDFHRHGERFDEYRQMMASSQGWPFILACYLQRLEE